MKKRKILWSLMILGIIIIGFIIFVIQSGAIRKVQNGCPISWKTYRNEVLGVEFCYNPAWGEPQTSPIENLTKLEGAVDRYSQNEQNASSNRISIDFTKTNYINLQFFNDNYKGEYYPNGNAIQYGNTDNFAKLKSTTNICDYKINFNTSFPGKLTTIWDNCQNKIKIALVQNKIDFGNQILYQYTLSERAFQKTQNGFFDNLLMTSNFGYVRQRAKPITSLKEIFKGNLLEKTDNTKVGEVQYNQEKKDFEIFVYSVKVFKPIPKTIPAFVIKAGEDSDITTIRHYYYYLANSQLQNAYDMYLEPQLDFTSYTEQYKNTIKAEPRDFVKKADHEYEFYVDYQENNIEPTVYHVKMAAQDSKIKTVLSEEITSQIVESGSMKAFVKKVNDLNFVVIVENDQVTIIDQASTNFEDDSVKLGEVKIFSSPEFSSTGKFLYYTFSGWEWSAGNVYNIAEKRKILSTASADDHGFTQNEQFFYACNSPGMGEGSGLVWQLSDAKTVFDIYEDKTNNNYMDIKCQYNKGDKFISFILSKFYADNNGTPQPAKTLKFTF